MDIFTIYSFYQRANTYYITFTFHCHRMGGLPKNILRNTLGNLCLTFDGNQKSGEKTTFWMYKTMKSVGVWTTFPSTGFLAGFQPSTVLAYIYDMTLGAKLSSKLNFCRSWGLVMSSGVRTSRFLKYLGLNLDDLLTLLKHCMMSDDFCLKSRNCWLNLLKIYWIHPRKLTWTPTISEMKGNSSSKIIIWGTVVVYESVV